jgi:CDK5 regulatory subunit-associated protein 3
MTEIVDLDLDYAKLLDWLQDRRRIARGWHASLKAARVLLLTAADALPHTSPLAATPPTTYHPLVAVLNAIADSSVPPPFAGARDTDYLNRYSHPATRAWAAARSSYESGAAYLAEAAQTLVRSADVDAPALREEMARLRESIAECARKEGPTIRSAADAKVRFRAACNDRGVPDCVDGVRVDFEKALRAAVARDAPDVLQRAVEAGKEPILADALSYYGNFSAYTCGSQVPRGSTVQEALCATLSEVIVGGRDALMSPLPESEVASVCTEEFRHGEGSIDWNVVVTSTSAADAGGAEIANIDWGIEIDGAGAAACPDAEKTKGNVDVATDASLREGGGIDWGDVVESTKKEVTGSYVSVDGAIAFHVTLADAATRESYSNDLLELRAFLVQRIAELSRGDDTQASLILQQSRAVPNAVRAIDRSRAEQMAAAVHCALESVAGTEARRVLGLQASTDEVARAARDLSDKLHAWIRAEGNIASLAARKAAAGDELRNLGAKFEVLAVETRELMRLTEMKLEEFYKGRKVHILGEINLTFPACDENSFHC